MPTRVSSVAVAWSLGRRVLITALALFAALALPAAGFAERPGFYSNPTISGAPAIGATLLGNEGGLNCVPACGPAGPEPSVPGVYFEWLSCSGPSAGGSDRPTGGMKDDPQRAQGCVVRVPPTKGARSYVVKPEDRGRYLQLHVVATNHDCNAHGADCRYSTGHGYSATAGPVGTTPPPPPPPGAPGPPVNTALPSISGLVEHMRTLAVSPGSWTGAEPISFTYQWLRCSTRLRGCARIEGATAHEYRLQAVDVGARMIILVTARNNGGTSVAASRRTTHVAPAKPGPGNRVLPVVEVSAPNALRVGSVRFDPRVLRRGAFVRVTVVVKDRRGFLIEDATVSVSAAQGALKGRGKTNAEGRAVMRLRVGRLPAGRTVVATVSAGKRGDPAVRAVKILQLAVRR